MEFVNAYITVCGNEFSPTREYHPFKAEKASIRKYESVVYNIDTKYKENALFILMVRWNLRSATWHSGLIMYREKNSRIGKIVVIFCRLVCVRINAEPRVLLYRIKKQEQANKVMTNPSERKESD